MKCSVALATYKGEKYILEQLESIRTQTHPVDQVIICDDRSGDQTVELIERYCQKYQLQDWLKLSVNEKNLGYADNFMRALSLTDGDYIFFCDQDDIWLPDRVENMVALMEEHPDMELLASEFSTFSVGEDATSIPDWERKSMKGNGELEKLAFSANNIFIGAQGCTMCMRRSLYQATKAYHFSGWAHDEYAWKLALCRDGLYKYYSPTLQRRLHAGNASLQKPQDLANRVKYVEELLASHRATLRYLEDSYKKEQNPELQKKISLMKHQIKGSQMRLCLLKKKHIFLTIPLFFSYRDCYHKKRSLLKEPLMALRG